MKIHILFDIRPGAYGGGTQFLKGLKGFLESRSCYAGNPEEADVFIFNSHQNIKEVARMKRLYPGKPFIHRIDGPMRLYNRMSDRRDTIVNTANRLIADGTVFQSAWSREKNLSLGLERTPFETVIGNAPDPAIFNEDGKTSFGSGEKIRLIAVSWSANEKKGFDVYRWLDAHLDFSRYEMVFVGNSPTEFRNIKLIPTLGSEGVAAELKKSDIYITASKVEACSNTLVEALHCGLAVLAIDNTSHGECMGGRGELFRNPEDLPALLNAIASDPQKYLNSPFPPTMKEVSEKYHSFAEGLLNAGIKGEYHPKQPGAWNCLKLHGTLTACRFYEFARGLLVPVS